MAAGILMVSHDAKILMIEEKRQGCVRYNFIGGKRECRADMFGLPRLETGFETAKTEFLEETGEPLTARQYESVYWFPESKYLLFVVRDDKVSGKNLRWFSPAEIEEGIQQKSTFHEYVMNHLRRVLS